MPTWFSFLGIVNFQKVGDPLPEVQDFWKQMLCLTGGGALKDGHHFENKNNFCLDKGGNLKILDYGAPKTEEVILKYGRAIMDGFSLGKEENGK